ncbi:MAG: glycosyltransferase family 2 protein [Deltaproteobacteria bacterium]|nr:glycosyltransferase family 2 protein [Deltaproteobacteria bacterium]
MFRGISVAVVMPAFNVEEHIANALGSLPAFVDQVVVVDDASDDATVEVAVEVAAVASLRVEIVRHEKNQGVGAAIQTGYAHAVAQGAQLVAVMAGDAQMDPADLPRLLKPAVEGRADYVKGNRFRHGDIWRAMPKSRLLGNIFLSVFTKVTSGYPHIFDSQCGYTVITREALQAIDGRFFARYGYPNDLLARLRVVGARVMEEPVRPVYEGQASGIRIWTVLYPILGVLFLSMARRLWHQRLRPLFGQKAPRVAHLSSDAHRRPDHLLPARTR